MENDRLYELISRKLAGEANPEEIDELREYFKNNPHDQYINELITSYWNSRHDESEQDEADSDEHFKHILQMADETTIDTNKIITEFEEATRRNNKKIWINRLIAVAAIFMLIVGASLWFSKSKEENKSITENAQNEIEAKKGIRSRMVLPDGSLVWLNSASKLKYQNKFNDSLRVVYLDGEAFFDVKKDNKRPFIVHASGIEIKVLGTAFTVKAYEQEQTVEATLIRGSIEVINQKDPHKTKVILKPHEKMVFVKTEEIQTKQQNAPIKKRDENTPILITRLPANISDTALAETAWVYNKLICEGDTFRELAVKMERWFNVKIHFLNDKVASSRPRVIFQDEPIEEALRALQVIVPFSYSINGDEIIIEKK